MKKALHELNRLSRNTATVGHVRHKGHPTAFLRHGSTTRFPQERELDGHRMAPPDGMPRVPPMLAIAAHQGAA
ncbi:hypothetical protein [Burkholderia ambifaria]|uniref:Uncharacterized protein n=1 Tax=Burkholderia ambifaria MEX-5 TaxID=396597 RepID=B1TGK3_9BURK|nr:hypothetical protein [Burkholderia ambifaria]EDT37304.1 hypothetical protein BamMEX5DRAFT_6919 [Burkholderia ambifaria MEX-5]